MTILANGANKGKVRRNSFRRAKTTRLVSSFPDPGDRQIAIDLLTAAKKRIQNWETEYVCYAIDSVCYMRGPGLATPRLEAVAQRLRDVIHGALRRHATVTAWLDDKHLNFHEVTRNRHWCRLYRMAWIDSMIKQLRAPEKVGRSDDRDAASNHQKNSALLFGEDELK